MSDADEHAELAASIRAELAIGLAGAQAADPVFAALIRVIANEAARVEQLQAQVVRGVLPASTDDELGLLTRLEAERDLHPAPSATLQQRIDALLGQITGRDVSTSQRWLAALRVQVGGASVPLQVASRNDQRLVIRTDLEQVDRAALRAWVRATTGEHLHVTIGDVRGFRVGRSHVGDAL